MRRFECDRCGREVFFENDKCGACGAALAYDPDKREIVVRPAPRRCANYELAGCNWLVRDSEAPFCRACRRNRTIPNLSTPRNVALWANFEAAKRRLFDGLLALGLPFEDEALAFDCIDDVALPNCDARRAMTGHNNGLITIALAEADPARREEARVQMAEPYRTLLGHLRHEIGHYYWDVLVKDEPARLAAFRKLFGDERRDYAEALKAHYADGPGDAWRETHISAYAAAHPWEDFAETWAHTMHILDTLETASAFRIAVQATRSNRARARFDAYSERKLDRLLDAWGPLTIALNCMNRSMGQPDLYPFVLSPPAIEKLAFVRNLMWAARRRRAGHSRLFT